ncbi:MAG: ribonuclease E activity regulator RraA [Gammaproteobacteria bacterium]|nr:ribonuclease E activity regulator RraA [Gammaproteobacteria bacterium]
MKTADLSDQHTNIQYCTPVFSSFGANKRFSGSIRTVKCYEDNSMVRQMLELPGNGSVLVVDAGASKRCAMLGDVLAQMGVDNGWSGVVMNGLIRDSADINQMPIGVRALGTFPLKSQKEGKGEIDVIVHFAGAFFETGHFLYADEDGIIVSKNKL